MTIDNEKIVEIAHKTPTSEAFMTYAACRDREVRDGVSQIDALRTQMAKEGFLPVPQDLAKMFKELHTAGVGELRGGMFKWHVSIKEVGKVGMGAKKTVTVPKKAPKPTALGEAGRSTVHMLFASGKEISISYTEKLTKEELDFLHKTLLK